MDSIITTCLLLFAVKENPHWVSEVYRFPILARKCHKWPSFWLKPEEECSQARTCPLWKVAPGKSVGLFALQCYQWCGEFMRVLHACLNSTSLIPLITQIPRILHVYKQLIQILLVLLHLEMKLEECWIWIVKTFNRKKEFSSSPSQRHSLIIISPSLTFFKFCFFMILCAQEGVELF